MIDGDFTYYKIQFLDDRGRWCDADLSYFLFGRMTQEEKRSVVAWRIRDLIRFENLFWQKSFIQGFAAEDREVALLVLELCIEYHPEHSWRLAAIWCAQRTVSIAEHAAEHVAR